MGLGPKDFLTDREHEQLIEDLRSKIDEDRVKSVMLLVSVYTGARSQEVLNLTWHHIYVSDCSIFFKTLKGGKNRTIPIPEWLMKEISKLDKNIERLFPMSRQGMFRAWERFRPNKKVLKSLRNSYAVKALKKKNDINLVKYALGHKSITSTSVYLDHVYSNDKLKDVI